MPVIVSRIRSGKIDDNAQRHLDFLTSRQPEESWCILNVQMGRKRSIPQNSLWKGIIAPAIVSVWREAGNMEPEDFIQAWARKEAGFAWVGKDIDGKLVETVRSSADLTTPEMVQLCDWGSAWLQSIGRPLRMEGM